MPIISGGSGSGSGSGAMTLITISTAAATAASFDFQNIAQTFNHLKLVANVHCDNPAAAGVLNLKLNNDSTAAYDSVSITGTNAGAGAVAVAAATAARIAAVPGTSAPAAASGLCEIIIPNYAATTFYKTWAGTGGRKDADAIGNVINEAPWGSWRNAAAITRVTLLVVGTAGTAQNFVTGSSAALYGIT